MNDSALVKVHVSLGEDSEIEGEWLWAEPCGDHYRIANVPFCTTTVSLGDVVSTELHQDELGTLYLEVTGIVQASGATTSLLQFVSLEPGDEVVAELRRLGADLERATELIWAMSTPADAYDAIAAFVHELIERGVLDADSRI